MTKARTKAKPKEPLATDAQKERIEELGVQIYGEGWPRIRKRLYKTRMTQQRAYKLLVAYGRILGGKV
jgi:hypothetical protein